MKIGLVGEAPNNTNSIKNLFEKEYIAEKFSFFSLLDRINGSQLDHQKTKRFLRIEYEEKNPDIVIFIRDLDSILPNSSKVRKRKAYFSSSNSVVDKKGVFLLNIYEIEALILSDIDTFNSIYECKLKTIDNPMLIEEPKEYLRSESSKYCESDNPEIFKKIVFEKAKKCKYFNDFINKFNKTIKLVS